MDLPTDNQNRLIETIDVCNGEMEISAFVCQQPVGIRKNMILTLIPQASVDNKHLIEYCEFTSNIFNFLLAAIAMSASTVKFLISVSTKAGKLLTISLSTFLPNRLHFNEKIYFFLFCNYRHVTVTVIAIV